VTPARRRLAAQAAAAGYSAGALALIAQAALPGYRPGDQLDELLVEHVRTAVEILAQAGLPGDALGAVVAHHHRRYGEAWREHFWRRQLRLASLRFKHAELYGAPPREPDPARPAPSVPLPGGRAA
jgi:hypothetical protein